MVLEGDRAASPWRLTHGDILIEGGRAFDRRFINTLVFPNRISCSVARYSPLLRTKTRGTAVVLDDIVLDKRAGGPAVDRQKASSATNTERPAEGNWAVRL